MEPMLDFCSHIIYNIREKYLFSKQERKFT